MKETGACFLILNPDFRALFIRRLSTLRCNRNHCGSRGEIILLSYPAYLTLISTLIISPCHTFSPAVIMTYGPGVYELLSYSPRPVEGAFHCRTHRQQSRYRHPQVHMTSETYSKVPQLLFSPGYILALSSFNKVLRRKGFPYLFYDILSVLNPDYYLYIPRAF